MPIRKVPVELRDKLPKHAKEIFIAAFNSAYEEYSAPKKRKGGESLDEISRKVAWSAVKNKYKKGQDNKWHRKKA